MKHPFPQLEFPSVDAIQDIESLTTATQEIYNWIIENVVGNDVLPRRCPAAVADSLGKVHRYSENLKSKIQNLRSAETDVFMEMFRKAQQKEMLSPAEYYYLRSLDLIRGLDDEHSEYRRYQRAFESKNDDRKTTSNETEF